MIKGVHTMFHSSQPDALRAFLRDKLQFPFADVGGGWLIFQMPEADMGVHPSAEQEADGRLSGTHDISFYCDDIQGTVADMRERGVVFDGDVADHGYGFVTYFTMPGDVRVQLYEPKYQKQTAAKPAAPAPRKRAAPARAAARSRRKATAKAPARTAGRAKAAKPKAAAKGKAKARARAGVRARARRR